MPATTRMNGQQLTLVAFERGLRKEDIDSWKRDEKRDVEGRLMGIFHPTRAMSWWNFGGEADGMSAGNGERRAGTSYRIMNICCYVYRNSVQEGQRNV